MNQTEPAPARLASPPGNQPRHDESHTIPDDLPKVGKGTMTVAAIALIVVLAILFVVGYLPHRRRIAEANAIAADHDDRPLVDLVQPKRSAAAGELRLPGDARAMQETPIYPRTNGYLKRILVDIGDRAAAGQLLAEIDTPEIDAQLNEARATLEQVKTSVTKTQADLDLAQATLKRYQSLSKTGAVTPQDLDEKQSTFNQARAALAASRANVTASEAAVQRVVELQSFEKVSAPFAGVISARNFDVGALLSSGGTGKELFRIEHTDTLRVFVNVPQTYATSVKIGQEAGFMVRNFPGRSFAGKLARSAGSLDPATRTLRFEVDVPNADNVLLPGMYGEVRFQITHTQPPLVVPTSALVFASDGTKLAVVENGKVRFQKIQVGRDLGTELEIAGGLSGDEQVVSNPGERLADGVDVKVVSSPKPAEPQHPAQREAAVR